MLTYMCGSEDLQLWLDFDAADLAPLSASDFLEKIGLVLDRLGAEPDMRCSKLVLLTRAARGLIPDLAREIPICDYEFIPSVFFRVAAQYSEHPAIANDSITYTYAELSRAVSHLANQLVAAGLAVGETVAISGCSSFGVLASLLAVPGRGRRGRDSRPDVAGRASEADRRDEPSTVAGSGSSGRKSRSRRCEHDRRRRLAKPSRT